MNAPRDPFLELELDGVRLIEASAGTGKTFTLATLVTRLLIERGLRIGQILAVTYTDAAAQDLREKLRQRIALAVRIAIAWPDEAEADVGDPAYPVTHAIVQAQARRDDIAALRRRLRRAEQETDLAAVSTIHGWCTRVLADHALETGQDFIAPELIGSERTLREECANDLWRNFGQDAHTTELMQQQWKDPPALAKDLHVLLGAQRMLPAVPPETPDPLPEVQRAAGNLRAVFATHGDTARALLDAAIAAKALNANSYKAAAIDTLWRTLRFWAAQESAPPPDARLGLLAPEHLSAKTNKGKVTPQSPLFEAVARYLAAEGARQAWLADRRLALMHRARTEAATLIERRKRELRVRTYDDLIDAVFDALGGEQGPALTECLRKKHAAALVDEFQDTDERQWTIFRHVFGESTLFLIGDPKQAIYRFRGGDVHAYLAAAREASPAPALTHNFRSRPVLLRAIDALYAQAGAVAFVDSRIRFRAVEAGGSVADADFLRAGTVAPALTLRRLPAQGDGEPWNAGDSRAHATAACVEAIHALLQDARAGRASIRPKADQSPRALRAGDIAVLVRKHAEATQVRAALVAAGIPAVAAGKRSVFASEAAQELLTLFEALQRPGDEARLRAALATVLLGQDAEAIARLDADDEARRDWQLRAQGWRERWERHGPLPLIADRCADNAPRLLARDDGERRLTDAMQLGELLQEASLRVPALRGLVDWLRSRIAQADDEDEAAQLRLESDARCVQILTLHKSKGLEFPLVFLPFAAIGGGGRSVGRYCEYHDENGRVLRLQPADASDPDWQDAVAASRTEDAAEDARLLYVGLTRAQHALWLASGPLHASGNTPLAPMLGDLDALRALDGIAVDEGELPDDVPSRLPPETATPPPPARIARRALRRDWWVYSFSSLQREDAGGENADERGAADETAGAADTRFAGTRFGNALHSALERLDFARWRDAAADAPPSGDEEILASALRREGYAEADLAEGVPLLVRMIRATLHARLPEGRRLCDLPVEARRAEMEFHFALAPVDIDRLIALLHAHGIASARNGFGSRRRIEGLMTGRIDLVYEHAGRFHVLDYKSNRLSDYGADALAEAMRESEYDLQALIYTLALHRWLRFRLGEAYDYDTHVGGARYLFCRGLDESGAGIHAQRPSRELIEALDALFGANARSAA